MPKEIQDKFVKTLPGLENVVIQEYGYAVEYDYIDPRCLKYTLESKKGKKIYFLQDKLTEQQVMKKQPTRVGCRCK